MKSTLTALCFDPPTWDGEPNNTDVEQCCILDTPGCACISGYPAFDRSLSEGIGQPIRLSLVELEKEAEQVIWLNRVTPTEFSEESNDPIFTIDDDDGDNDDMHKLDADKFGGEGSEESEFDEPLESDDFNDSDEGNEEDDIGNRDTEESQDGEDDDYDDEQYFAPRARDIWKSKSSPYRSLDSTSYNSWTSHAAPRPLNIPTSPQRIQTKFQIPWTQIEKDTIGELMRDVMNTGEIAGTQEKWRKIQVRLAAYNYCERPRTWNAIKNYWNREGRAAHNLDERVRPRPDLMITGHKRNREDTTNDTTSGRKKKRKRINIVSVEAEELDSK